MDTKYILIINAICVVRGFDLRNLSKGVKAFYDLADNDLDMDDFMEIMDYLDQRFQRKCFSFDHSVNMNVNTCTRDIVEIVGKLEATTNKISSDIIEDRTSVRSAIADMKTRLDTLSNQLKEHIEDQSHSVEDDFVSLESLCSVKEYQKSLTGEYCIPMSPILSNLALGKPARQSSDSYGDSGKASAAVDGNRDSNYSTGKSCIHTGKENPWWEVDLQTESLVGRVVIVNRDDRQRCGVCGSRLRNVVVTVSREQGGAGEECGRFAGPGSPGQIIEMECPKQIVGRYVKLQMNSENYLHVCEVEVYSQ